MKISVIPAKSLTPDLIQRWSDLQQADPAFSDPFFSPHYLTRLALVRDHLCVGLLQEGAEVVGFFPFRKGKYAMAGPVDMCDRQGLILKKGTVWSPEELLRGCGLVAWDFNRLVDWQACNRGASHFNMSRILRVRFTGGYEAYFKDLQARKPKHMGNLLRSQRRLEETAGPLRFEYQCPDPKLLQTLLIWKGQKHHWLEKDRIWVNRVFKALLKIRSDRFQAVFSVLYAGKQPAALHFGLRSQKIWHYWFPAYDPQFKNFSPGTLLFFKMAEQAAAQGVEVLDLGKQGETYKERFKNDEIPIAEGAFERRSMVTVARKTLRGSVQFIRSTPALYRPARALKQRVKRAVS